MYMQRAREAISDYGFDLVFVTKNDSVSFAILGACTDFERGRRKH
jgi:hypothetical protein